MKLWDAHMHSSFSGDCDAPPEDMIQSALSRNLPGITFTDHLDLDYYHNPGEFDLDLPAYISTMDSLTQKYSGEHFQIQTGIELGLQEHLADTHRNILASYSFQEIIGSIHQVEKEDPYYDSFFLHRNVHQAYVQYFDAVIQNIKAFHEFDTLGHLDYIKRYVMKYAGPDGSYAMHEYQEAIDEILKLLIHYDLAMEINTGSIRYGFMDTNPSAEILHRYFELGGKLVTIGADAHSPEHIACGFEMLPSMLRNAGFQSYVIYKNRTPEDVPLEN